VTVSLVILGLPVFFQDVSTPVLIFTHITSILSSTDIPIIGASESGTVFGDTALDRKTKRN